MSDTLSTGSTNTLSTLERRLNELAGRIGQAQDHYVSLEPALVSKHGGHERDLVELTQALKDRIIEQFPASLHVFIRQFDPDDQTLVDFAEGTVSTPYRVDGREYIGIKLDALLDFWADYGHKPR